MSGEHPAHRAAVNAYVAWLEEVDEGACGCEDCLVRVLLEAAAPLIVRQALSHPVAAELRRALEAGDPLEPADPRPVLELVGDTPPD